MKSVLRLTSVDLGASADITSLAEVFDFAKDYLGLLKAAVIASGIVPPGIEGSGQNLSDLLAQVVGRGEGWSWSATLTISPKRSPGCFDESAGGADFGGHASDESGAIVGRRVAGT